MPNNANFHHVQKKIEEAKAVLRDLGLKASFVGTPNATIIGKVSELGCATST
jgi:hypothetical protein